MPAQAPLKFDPWISRPSMMQLAHSLGPHASRQYKNAQEIQNARQQIEDGQGKAILFAVVQCVEAGLTAPEWLADAFLGCFDRVMAMEATSWDDVFGRPFPKSTHFHALKKHRKLALPIFDSIEGAKLSGSPVDDLLFEDIGATFKIGKTTCKNIYYGAKEHFGWRLAMLRAAAETRLSEESD